VLIFDVDVGVVEDVVAAPRKLGVEAGVFPQETCVEGASAHAQRNPQRLLVDQQHGVRSEGARAMPLKMCQKQHYLVIFLYSDTQ
jgi:hypothetical protein